MYGGIRLSVERKERGRVSFLPYAIHPEAQICFEFIFQCFNCILIILAIKCPQLCAVQSEFHQALFFPSCSIIRICFHLELSTHLEKDELCLSLARFLFCYNYHVVRHLIYYFFRKWPFISPPLSHAEQTKWKSYFFLLSCYYSVKRFITLLENSLAGDLSFWRISNYDTFIRDRTRMSFALQLSCKLRHLMGQCLCSYVIIILLNVNVFFVFCFLPW